MSHRVAKLPFVCDHEKHGCENDFQLFHGNVPPRGLEKLPELLDSEAVVVTSVIFRGGTTGRSDHQSITMHVTCGKGQDHAHDDFVCSGGTFVKVAEAAPIPPFHIIVDDGRGREVLKVFMIVFREG